MGICTSRRMLRLELPGRRPGGRPKMRFMSLAKARHEVSCVRLEKAGWTIGCGRLGRTTEGEDSRLTTCLLYFPSRSTAQKHGGTWHQQRGGAELAGVRAVRPEAQRPAAAQRMHRPAVHGSARAPHGLPQGAL